MRMIDHLLRNRFDGLVQVKVNNLITRRHNAAYQCSIEIKNIADSLILLLLQASVFCTGIHHGNDVFSRDLLLTLSRQLQ